MLRTQGECSQHYARAHKLLLKIMAIRSFNVLFLCTVIQYEAFLPELLSMRPARSVSMRSVPEVFQQEK